MEIRWAPKALEMYDQTLDYWNKRNKSSRYSQKIMQEVMLAETELLDNPYFLTDFFENIKLYRKRLFNGKFYLFFEIIDEEDILYIQYFRSAYQKPLSLG